MMSETKIFKGGCPQDCPDTCAMIFSVEDGVLKSVTGNSAHPITRGGLCVKLKDFAKHHYNPDRIIYPQRRVGPKGSGHYEQISWAEALHEITTKWNDIIENFGSQAILNCCYLGNQGIINGLTSGDAFFNRLGATISEKTFCASGSSTGYLMTLGPTGGVDPESSGAGRSRQGRRQGRDLRQCARGGKSRQPPRSRKSRATGVVLSQFHRRKGQTDRQCDRRSALCRGPCAIRPGPGHGQFAPASRQRKAGACAQAIGTGCV